MDYHKLLQNRETVIERMNELYSSDDFKLNKEYLKEIHGYLFKNILPESGKYRDYNIRRHEVIINEESVAYEDHNTIDTYLDFVFKDIKRCNFDDLTDEEKINHIINIITNIWTIHPFSDGNTRTITIFIVKYLNSLGYDIDTSYFRKNAEYFRNAIVRAVYSNNNYHVEPNREPLYIFLDNIINKNNNKLRGDLLIVREMFEKNNKTKVRKKTSND